MIWQYHRVLPPSTGPICRATYLGDDVQARQKARCLKLISQLIELIEPAEEFTAWEVAVELSQELEQARRELTLPDELIDSPALLLERVQQDVELVHCSPELAGMLKQLTRTDHCWVAMLSSDPSELPPAFYVTPLWTVNDGKYRALGDYHKAKARALEGLRGWHAYLEISES